MLLISSFAPKIAAPAPLSASYVFTLPHIQLTNLTFCSCQLLFLQQNTTLIQKYPQHQSERHIKRGKHENTESNISTSEREASLIPGALEALTDVIPTSPAGESLDKQLMLEEGHGVDRCNHFPGCDSIVQQRKRSQFLPRQIIVSPWKTTKSHTHAAASFQTVASER